MTISTLLKSGVRSLTTQAQGSFAACWKNPAQCVCIETFKDERVKNLLSKLQQNPTPQKQISAVKVLKSLGGKAYMDDLCKTLSSSELVKLQDCAKVWKDSNTPYAATGEVLSVALQHSAPVEKYSIL